MGVSPRGGGVWGLTPHRTSGRWEASLAARMTPLRAAFGLLTVLPVRPPGDAAAMARGLPLFWAVGALVGVLMGGVHAALRPSVGAAAATVVAVAAAVLATGGLHEDGLADTADGLGVTGDRARRLAVMSDSRLGTYGVVALVLLLGLRVALLAPLEPAVFARTAVAAHALARAAMAALAGWLPPAADGGAGAALLAAADLRRCVLGAAGGAVAAVAVAGRWGLALTAAAALAAAGSGWVLRRRLGGLTGDGFGATAVTVEVAVLGLAAAIGRAGLLG